MREPSVSRLRTFPGTTSAPLRGAPPVFGVNPDAHCTPLHMRVSQWTVCHGDTLEPGRRAHVPVLPRDDDVDSASLVRPRHLRLRAMRRISRSPAEAVALLQRELSGDGGAAVRSD